jgi:hypothetical protein
MIISALRDFATGLRRGFSLFFTERNEFTAKTIAPGLRAGKTQR